jgi:hypothetical protein
VLARPGAGPGDLSMVLLALVIPGVLLVLPAGMLADRLPRGRPARIVRSIETPSSLSRPGSLETKSVETGRFDYSARDGAEGDREAQSRAAAYERRGDHRAPSSWTSSTLGTAG